MAAVHLTTIPWKLYVYQIRIQLASYHGVHIYHMDGFAIRHQIELRSIELSRRLEAKATQRCLYFCLTEPHVQNFFKLCQKLHCILLIKIL